MYLFDQNGNEVVIGDWVYYNNSGQRCVGIIKWVLEKNHKVVIRVVDYHTHVMNDFSVGELVKISESRAALLVLEK